MNLHKFKVGDKIVLRRPANTGMKKYVGCSTTVTQILGTNHVGYQKMVLESPFLRGFVYTSEQFDPVNLNLENI